MTKRTKPTRKRDTPLVEQDCDGWWAYYNPGWCSGEGDMGELHSDHADTRHELNLLVKDAQPCTCEQCKADLKEMES